MSKLRRVPFFIRHKGLAPAALWLAEDGRHYSGSPGNEPGSRPDMNRLREYLKPGRRLYICAWGGWAHGLRCTVAANALQRNGKPWPGWEGVEGPILVEQTRGGGLSIDVMVIVEGEREPGPCRFQGLTPFKRRR